MQLLTHPFRIVGGVAATAPDGSDAALADAVVRLCLTRPGELELVPAYGIPNPQWGDPAASDAASIASSVDVARLNAALATFGPPATVALLAVTRGQQGSAVTERVDLEVTRS
jgi:hypothetical protein